MMRSMVMAASSMVLVGAFAPALRVEHPRVQQQSIRMGVESMTGVGPETGDKVFDPVGFATMGGDKTLQFFRHAGIKHGHFPGYLSPTFGVSFESLSQMGPFEAWQAIPLLGQLQIIWTIAGLEHASECLDPA